MNQILVYLRQILDRTTVAEAFDAKGKLSLYMESVYELYVVKALGTKFLLARPKEERTVQQFKKHCSKLQEISEMDVAFAVYSLTPYKKKRMMEERIGFVCADQQMYLPFMGIHLKKQRKEEEIQIPDRQFTPSMQMIFLYILYSGRPAITQAEISEKLHLSSMTCSRALDKMAAWDLLDYSIGGKTGRKKVYQYRSKKEYYQTGKEYLINPVSKSFYVSMIPEGVHLYKNGLSALSDKSVLGDGSHLVMAVAPQEEFVFEGVRVPLETGIEEGFTEIQVMKYDVGLLTDDQCADRLTVIHSILERDERIEMAIEEMMEDFDWYKE